MSCQDADPPSALYPAYDLLLAESREWLARRGELVVGSGSFHWGRFSGSIHSDFGPADQDKSANQDYGLVWRSATDHGYMVPDDRHGLQFVLALGDGLTNSFRSEFASALACWVSARALIEAFGAAGPKDLARLAFNEAGLAIGRLADELAGDPEASCPEGQFVSTWKYILRKGGLFQTTLTLAWADQDHFHMAMLGDGGALWRGYRQANDRILAACNLDSQEVHALGPADRCLQDFDCWCEEELDGPFLAAISTDGIGRGFGTDPLALLDELESLHDAGVDNAARRFIEDAVRQRPRDFDDNMTLAVIRAE